MSGSTLTNYVEHYLAPHPSHQVRELFVSKTMLDFAVHMAMLFEPLYLHTQGGLSLPQVMLFYGVIYTLYFFALPLGGRICRLKGNERTMLLASPFLMMWYLSLLALPKNEVFLYVAVVVIVIQKILYWPGYHADFAEWSGKGETGREVGSSIVLTGIAAAFAPAVGGAIIAAFGYSWLLLLSCVLILFSNIPLLKQPEFYIPQPFSYTAALKRPFEKENRTGSMAFFGHGEDLLGGVAWPLFIVLIVSAPEALGIIVSVSTLVNVLVSLYVGRLSDEGERDGVLKSGAWFTAAAWFLRPLTAGGFGVFLMDSFYRVSKNMFGVPMYAARYEVARSDAEAGSADAGKVMESVVSYEMALALGKAAAAFLAALILWKFAANAGGPGVQEYAPLAWTGMFVLSALFSLLYGLMPSRMPMPVLAPDVPPEPSNR